QRNGTSADIVTNSVGKRLLPKQPEAFTHDLDGNKTSDGLWTNTWSAENRQLSIQSVSSVPSDARTLETWTYLPDGRWIERVVSRWVGTAYTAQTTNRYVWDGPVVAAVLNHTNGPAVSVMRGL